MKRTSVIFALLLILSSTSLFSQEWEFTVIDSPGMRPAIAIDSRGFPHVVFFEYGGWNPVPADDTTHVMYASWDSASGTFENESTILAAVHPLADITTDRNDSPHFVWHWHEPVGDATYTTQDGEGWAHDTIPSVGHDGFSVSLVLDENDLPHISFVNGETALHPDGVGIEYAFFDGFDWLVETVGSDSLQSHHSGTSIALDLNGNPNIAYYDSVRNDLMLATRADGGGWSINVVDSIGDPGRFSSMQFDSEGLPRIAYLDKLSETSGIVRLATMTKSGWVIQDLDTLYSLTITDRPRSRMVGAEGVISLALKSDDETLVAYSDQQVLKLATVDNFGSSTETVFEFPIGEGTLGQTASLALDSYDVPHIAYWVDFGDSIGTVMYAIRPVPDQISLASPPDGAIVTSDSVVLTWHEGYPGVDRYWLEGASDSLFSNPFIDSTLTDTTSIVSPLHHGQTLWWKVRAHNDNGWGAFSEAWSFLVLLEIPAPPLLSSPDSGAVGVSTSPQLTWNASVGSEAYSVQLSDIDDFSSLIVDEEGIAGTTLQVNDLSNGATYFWRVRAANTLGESDWSSVWNFSTLLTGVRTESEVPEEFSLSQNYPNPFNPSTTITYGLSEDSHVIISIYNTLGQEVATLVDENQSAGYQSVVWNGEDVASGIYLYTMTARHTEGGQAGDFVETKKLLLLK